MVWQMPQDASSRTYQNQRRYGSYMEYLNAMAGQHQELGMGPYASMQTRRERIGTTSMGNPNYSTNYQSRVNQPRGSEVFRGLEPPESRDPREMSMYLRAEERRRERASEYGYKKKRWGDWYTKNASDTQPPPGWYDKSDGGYMKPKPQTSYIGGIGEVPFGSRPVYDPDGSGKIIRVDPPPKF